ncbi:MAG: virulence RhuM family protein, partial [Kiritimatiellae bacterium]|nr:virulence RhuM family protein [Kiritimatiellia bacterium]
AAELFGIRATIQEIAKSGELEGLATTRKIRVVRLEGKRNVSRSIDFYNRDMIISVGYRVNSRRGVLFKRFGANRVLM